MTPAEKRAHLAESIRLLATHEPFIQFMAKLSDMKEQAVRDAVRMDVVDNTGRMAASLGEIRTYLDLEDMVSEFAQKSLE